MSTPPSLPLPLRLGALLLAASSLGCVTTRALRTSSGIPEALMRDDSPERVELVLEKELVHRGFRIVHRSPRVLVVERAVGDADTVLRFGAGWHMSGDYRVTCLLNPEPPHVRVVCEVQIVTEPGEDERVKDAPHGIEVAHELMDILEVVQGTVALQTHARFIESLEAQEKQSSHAPLWDDEGR